MMSARNMAPHSKNEGMAVLGAAEYLAQGDKVNHFEIAEYLEWNICRVNRAIGWLKIKGYWKWEESKDDVRRLYYYECDKCSRNCKSTCHVSSRICRACRNKLMGRKAIMR